MRSIGCLSSLTKLRKLSLTACPLNTSLGELKKIPDLPHLEILHIGAIGVNGSPTLTDSALYALTDVLEPLTRLENVSLMRNSKLGLTSRKGEGALADFICRVGRKCTVGQLRAGGRGLFTDVQC